MVCIYSETYLEKVIFFFASGYQLEITFPLGMDAHIYFPSQHWNSVWLRPVQAMCILPVWWLHIYVSLIVSRRFCFLCVSHVGEGEITIVISFMKKSIFKTNFLKWWANMELWAKWVHGPNDFFPLVVFVFLFSYYVIFRI